MSISSSSRGGPSVPRITPSEVATLCRTILMNIGVKGDLQKLAVLLGHEPHSSLFRHKISFLRKLRLITRTANEFLLGPTAVAIARSASFEATQQVLLQSFLMIGPVRDVYARLGETKGTSTESMQALLRASWKFNSGRASEWTRYIIDALTVCGVAREVEGIVVFSRDRSERKVENDVLENRIRPRRLGLPDEHYSSQERMTMRLKLSGGEDFLISHPAVISHVDRQRIIDALKIASENLENYTRRA
jgi:hypothetical protein